MVQSLFQKGTEHAEGFREIDPDTLHAHRRGATIIDVREPHEFDGELGHVPGARLVPLAHVPVSARAWRLDDEIVVICRSGVRSAHAARELVRLGFRRVVNVRGGMVAYSAANLPIERRS